MPVLQAPALARFVGRIFEAAGAPADVAEQVAASLVQSNLVGHHSHGVIRVRQYLDSIAAGTLNPQARPTIEHETAVLTLVNAQRGFGQLAARFAMETAITKARAQGLAATGLHNSNHVGRLGEWVSLAAEQELIGLAFCNGGGPRGTVTPFGGSTRLLGTNPVAAAVPVAGRPPIVVDFATSATAEGKLRIARNRGQSIPSGWIVGPDGQPSTRPEDFYAGGALLPAADHKGYGLSLLVELLAGMLTGHGSPAIPGFTGGNGVLFLALSTAAFRPAAAVLAENAALCEQVKAVPPAAGFAEVLLPGEPEQQAATRQQHDGIAIDETTWAQIVDAAGTLGVGVPDC